MSLLSVSIAGALSERNGALTSANPLFPSDSLEKRTEPPTRFGTTRGALADTSAVLRSGSCLYFTPTLMRFPSRFDSFRPMPHDVCPPLDLRLMYGFVVQASPVVT